MTLWCLSAFSFHSWPPSCQQLHSTFCFPSHPALHHPWDFARALSASWFILPLLSHLADPYFFVRPRLRRHFSTPAPSSHPGTPIVSWPIPATYITAPSWGPDCWPDCKLQAGKAVTVSLMTVYSVSSLRHRGCLVVLVECVKKVN